MTIQIAELVLITIFYFVYFYKQISLRKSGIKTDRLAKGNKPKRTMIIESVLLVATYGTALIQYVSIFFSKHMTLSILPDLFRVAGVFVTAIGVLFFALATTTMRDSWRAGIDETQKTAMITNGIYKLSRNPAFVGFDLLYIGASLSTPGIMMILAALFSIVLLHLQIIEEEKYLPIVFGKVYVEYKKKTPRYLFF